MKTNLINKSMHFIRYLSANRKSIYQDFNKNEEILRLLHTERFQTFFQPIVSLHNGSTIGYEILNRPEQTPNFPTTDSFYDYVGESKHLFLVERFIRNLALERYQKQVNSLSKKDDAIIFLNIQPQVLADPSYQEGITLDLLSNHNIAANQIVLELTEKEAVVNYAKFEKIIEDYRERGFQIAVDDAGTGYNSLQTLLYLKPEYIKIDKSLIRNIEEQTEKQHLVELILEFAFKFRTKVIAEGIETAEEFAYLRKMGVDFGQGYALGKPRPTLHTGTLPGNYINKAIQYI
ncbi:EAL domain-containing protein [Oceanobacillus piezotolerans]|uniref:EAL domain-containing protein n=1 Tax=Oceanobacillus piezotolerans TaxID=2448030 RepID=A0A498DTT1_9BACI|nr:EAL domain-containing protein [Oceanobacillus piezotolerans]RLL48267.1 EAL domain-containing protein [Oceanobacillus piezotolerans]